MPLFQNYKGTHELPSLHRMQQEKLSTARNAQCALTHQHTEVPLQGHRYVLPHVRLAGSRVVARHVLNHIAYTTAMCACVNATSCARKSRRLD